MCIFAVCLSDSSLHVISWSVVTVSSSIVVLWGPLFRVQKKESEQGEREEEGGKRSEREGGGRRKDVEEAAGLCVAIGLETGHSTKFSPALTQEIRGHVF